VIASISFLLLVTMAASALLEGLRQKLAALIPAASVALMYVLSQVFTLLVAMLLFAVIFKVLPSARIKWRDVLPGAVVTAILFMLGRFGISFYISKNDFGNTYGAAAALVVLLVWIYYSSLIVYFGAEFTRAYITRFGSGINPKPFATRIDA
jgi:membrane protein